MSYRFLRGHTRHLIVFSIHLIASVCLAAGQTYVTPVTNDPPQYGPYNAIFLPDGVGLTQAIDAEDTVQMADAPWTMYAWIQPEEVLAAPALIAGLGDPSDEYARFLAAGDKAVIVWDGDGNSLRLPLPAGVSFAPGSWHFIAACFDGSRFSVYVDGGLLGGGTLMLGSVSPQLSLAPAGNLPAGYQHFGGRIEGFTLLRRTLSATELAKLSHQRQSLDDSQFEQGSEDWAIQSRQWIGYRQPQSPQTLPHSNAPFSRPVALPLAKDRPALTPKGDQTWSIGNWYLQAAPQVGSTAEQIDSPGFSTASWLAATVPGTVLRTMVDRGIYPNPYYGLDNMAIPESLSHQDYWYRTEFSTPAAAQGRHLTLTFEGINYRAEVWLNGHPLGTIKGAFLRGVFDVTNTVVPRGENVLAVRIAPPPHPGIPQEQSILGGPGENGGMMEQDGPTFLDTEGWDWIPAIRDRDSGIWQPVILAATGNVTIGDPQVITTLPLPDRSRASVCIHVPLSNSASAPVAATVTATFEGVSVTKRVILASGGTTIALSPADFPQLTVEHPRLWWPNGYGKPNLYHLTLTVTTGDGLSDTRQLQFGIREVTYVLGLLDPGGHLRQVVYDPSRAVAANGPVIDVTHQGIRQVLPQSPYPPFYPTNGIKGWVSWVESITPKGEDSPALKPAPAEFAGTRSFLVLMVNGVRIAVRGGNWGMDDAMKNVSRAHLEPYFKLEQNAGVNIIRNWVGQSTEQTFYNLADQYGLMVWNDFWESTENYNVEAQDPALFLRNARDVIVRYRNHPSIVLWCGRNEGVPQPVINRGLDKLVRELDGTRYYTPSSNAVNLQVSGPYSWQDPVLYYTTLNRGFSVETGTASMSTLASFKAWTPEPDQWPIDDVWAYHDWHQSGNGDTHPFMAAVQAMFGAPTSLADFERKAQMLNYVDHRAIFEGMNAHLWQPNSGRMLWMTHPSWPSNNFEIYSYDYSAQASYYGVKKALEPLHIQLDLSNGSVQIINTTLHAYATLSVTANAWSLDNHSLYRKTRQAAIASNSTGTVFALNLPDIEAHGVALIELTLREPSGNLVSHNLYWLAAHAADYRALDQLPNVPVTANATAVRDGKGFRVDVSLQNTGAQASLQNELTLVDANGERILPAYYSDNYVSLLPGQKREITIDYSGSDASGTPHLTLRGWNLSPIQVAVNPQKPN